jgi:hypothetical protein
VQFLQHSQGRRIADPAGDGLARSEAKEIVGGYAIVEVKSKDEAGEIAPRDRPRGAPVLDPIQWTFAES